MCALTYPCLACFYSTSSFDDLDQFTQYTCIDNFTFITQYIILVFILRHPSRPIFRSLATPITKQKGFIAESPCTHFLFSIKIDKIDTHWINFMNFNFLCHISIHTIYIINNKKSWSLLFALHKGQAFALCLHYFKLWKKLNISASYMHHFFT